MALELVTMSTRELDVLDIIRKIHEQRLTQVKAGEILGLSDRQVRRLCIRYERDGAAGLVSRQRGRPSNHRLAGELREPAVAIVRERYADFGPTLAHEKLLELHDIRVGRETLRKWLAAAGLWTTRRERLKQPHQPRHRRGPRMRRFHCGPRSRRASSPTASPSRAASSRSSLAAASATTTTA